MYVSLAQMALSVAFIMIRIAGSLSLSLPIFLILEYCHYLPSNFMQLLFFSFACIFGTGFVFKKIGTSFKCYDPPFFLSFFVTFLALHWNMISIG